MLIKGRDLLKASRGELLQGDPERAVAGFSIDTRTIGPGEFFVPLRGEKEDGHRYISAAAASGAGGAFCARRPPPGLPPQFLLIRVPDVLAALQQAAAFHRSRFALPVIGVTGSSGKTTTKDLIAGVLSRRMKVLKTEGNLNNEIGLPLTLLRLEESCRAAVLEMGMSAPGEIALLARLALPEIGVITNVGAAHLEQLGHMEAVAAAKEELLDALGAGGTAVLNADDPRLREMGGRFGGKIYTYGFSGGDIRGSSFALRGENSHFEARFPGGEEGAFVLPLPGRHLASNALAALATGYLLGVSLPEMASALQRTRITGGRLQLFAGPAGSSIIDDSYNANPDSVRAALDVLRELAGPRSIAVLGDMLELGPAEKELHREIGRYAAGCGIGALVTVGRLGAEIAAGASGAAGAEFPAVACPDHDGAVKAVQRAGPQAGWYILVKGSRGMQMEAIVEKLTGQAKGDSE